MRNIGAGRKRPFKNIIGPGNFGALKAAGAGGEGNFGAVRTLVSGGRGNFGEGSTFSYNECVDTSVRMDPMTASWGSIPYDQGNNADTVDSGPNDYCYDDANSGPLAYNSVAYDNNIAVPIAWPDAGVQEDPATATADMTNGTTLDSSSLATSLLDPTSNVPPIVAAPVPAPSPSIFAQPLYWGLVAAALVAWKVLK